MVRIRRWVTRTRRSRTAWATWGCTARGIISRVWLRMATVWDVGGMGAVHGRAVDVLSVARMELGELGAVGLGAVPLRWLAILGRVRLDVDAGRLRNVDGRAGELGERRESDWLDASFSKRFSEYAASGFDGGDRQHEGARQGR